MSSHKPSGAVNQQERPGFEQWIVGSVDGEGCLSIAVVRNAVCRLGWQVQHEVAVTQVASSRSALKVLGRHFQCERLIESIRHDLIERIVPFFDANPLMTAKRNDFASFRTVLTMVMRGDHLTPEGLGAVARITEGMNRKQRSRFLESSEAIRQPAHSDE